MESTIVDRMGEHWAAYRSQLAFALGAIGSALMFLVWFLNVLGFLHWGGGIGHPVFSAFILILPLPLIFYMTYLALCQSPVIATHKEAVEFESVTFPWRRSKIPWRQIKEFTWKGDPDISPRFLILELKSPVTNAPERPCAFHVKNDGRLFFELSNTTTTPRDAAAILKEYLREREADVPPQENRL